MKKFNYMRKNQVKRSQNTINLGIVGSFNEVNYDNSDPTEEVISGILFKSFHCIKTGTGHTVFRALKSVDEPSVFYAIWSDYPYLQHLEEGGDIMLQEFKKDKNLKYLLVDNTFVQSGWMKDNVVDYLNNAWYPGLIEVGVQGFAHLQAESVLGSTSFEKFAQIVNSGMEELAKALDKKPFFYIPIKTSELKENMGGAEFNLRKKALENGLSSLKKINIS